MVIPRSLLFKGLGLCAICTGGAALYFKGGDLKGLVSSSSGKKKVWGGLECQEPTPQGSNCVLKTGDEKIFVKKKSGDPFQLTTLESGKIKVYKVEGEEYSDGFKFLIEDNDITATDNNKLEEFETYEIKSGGDSDVETLKGQHYLSQKTDSREGIKKALGLPDTSCDLPTANTPQTCDISGDKLGTIKFDGRTGATISGGTVTLTISKESSKTEFPLGYKFTFKNTNDADSTLTFGGNSITLKKNSPVDFKIKKEGSSLSLEKAWTLEELAKKVGLVKDGEDYWDVGNSGINVKLNDSTKKNEITKYTDSEGRIKVYSNQAEYSEGLKFTIEKGDLKLKEYNESGNTSEFYLGQFQSFEVVKDAGTWYLSRKDEALGKVKDALGLKCDLPTATNTPSNCDITGDKIKTIKFDGAGSGDVSSTGSPKLTISKESGRLDYPLGYKFTFSSTTDSSIVLPSGSTPSSIPLKSNLSYEYKIKRGEDNKNHLSLERAWTPKVLMERAIGFAEGSKENGWNKVGKEGISIKQDTHKASSAKASGDQNAKIKVYEGVPDYNQGMKFVVEEGDTDLTNGGSVSKLSKYETYEISQDSNDNNNWYFTRKKKSEEYIRELLGLPDSCSMPTDQAANSSCELDSNKLNEIKFKDKGTTGSTSIADSGDKVTLSISKVTGNDNGFPLGYKFTFTSDQHGFTVPKNGGGNIEVKKNTNTEFKIKESGSTLTLERVWDINKLAEKVKLTCTGSESKCSFGEKINVWDAENNYVDEAAIAADSSSQKITYEENADGYNQGFKYFVNEDITLENGTGPSNGKVSTICKKTDGGGCTYQIMEKTEGGSAKWYLVKK